MHLTFPLPVPATNSSLFVSYLNSKQLDSESVRYNIYLDNLTTVGDLIKVVDSKQNNLSATKINKYQITDKK